MKIDAQALQKIVDEICTTTLGLECSSIGDFVVDESDAMAAMICISGGWDAVVQVLTPMSTAKRFASAMFAVDSANLVDEEIRDALGEMVNMVGGNLKGLVGLDSSLSLPDVSMKDGVELFAEQFTGITTTYQCHGNSFVVRLNQPCVKSIGQE